VDGVSHFPPPLFIPLEVLWPLPGASCCSASDINYRQCKTCHRAWVDLERKSVPFRKWKSPHSHQWRTVQYARISQAAGGGSTLHRADGLPLRCRSHRVYWAQILWVSDLLKKGEYILHVHTHRYTHPHTHTHTHTNWSEPKSVWKRASISQMVKWRLWVFDL